MNDPVAHTPEDQTAFGGWQDRAILVVDDEPGMRSFLQRSLETRCGRVESASSVEEAAVRLGQRHFDLVILDNAMPGKKGVDWLHEIRDAGLHTEVILITAFADLETAIRALQAGAADFLLKPFRINQILNAIARCFDRANLRRENYILRRTLLDNFGTKRQDDDGLIGDSAALLPIRAGLRRLASAPTTVLITGEIGSGKEIAARALHQLSSRSGNAFVPLNCGAIAAEAIESELFGHAPNAHGGGASTREGLFFYAQGGTLFLDDINTLPLAVQEKLVYALQEHKIRPVGAHHEIPINVRVVAASSADLNAAVRQGLFRADLYNLLNVVQLAMPPLRERADDIAPLAAHFLKKLAAQLGLPLQTPDEEELALLRRHRWPGNVRELRNVMERWLILGHFPYIYFASSIVTETPPSQIRLEVVGQAHVSALLAEVEGDRHEAARRLGVSRQVLERQCAAWGL